MLPGLAREWAGPRDLGEQRHPLPVAGLCPPVTEAADEIAASGRLEPAAADLRELVVVGTEQDQPAGAVDGCRRGAIRSGEIGIDHIQEPAGAHDTRDPEAASEDRSVSRSRTCLERDPQQHVGGDLSRGRGGQVARHDDRGLRRQVEVGAGRDAFHPLADVADVRGPGREDLVGDRRKHLGDGHRGCSQRRKRRRTGDDAVLPIADQRGVGGHHRLRLEDFRLVGLPGPSQAIGDALQLGRCGGCDGNRIHGRVGVG